MEAFKFLLFGLSGVSVIFWVAVFGIWHVDMFPRFFKEDRTKDMTRNVNPISLESASGFIGKGELRPVIANTTGLQNRFKYSRKSLVIADFSPLEKGYANNRLYTAVLLSIGIGSFFLISYGLRSGLYLTGINNIA